MRLIDADALIEILAVMQGRCNTKAELIHNSKIWQQVKDLPAVDAVPVIRCKECRHLVRYNGAMVCSEPNGMMTFSPDGFCSYGQRRKDVE